MCRVRSKGTFATPQVGSQALGLPIRCMEAPWLTVNAPFLSGPAFGFRTRVGLIFGNDQV